MRISIALNLVLLPAWTLSQRPSPSAPSTACARNPEDVSKYSSRSNCLETEDGIDMLASWSLGPSRSTSQKPVKEKRSRRAFPGADNTWGISSLWRRLVRDASAQLERRQQRPPPRPTDDPPDEDEDDDDDDTDDEDGDGDDDDGDDRTTERETPTPTATRSTSTASTPTATTTTSSSSSSSSSSTSSATTLSTQTSSTESSTPSATPEPEDDAGMNTAGIAAGSVFGGFVMIALVFLGIVYYRRWHNYRERERQERLNRLQENSPDDGGLPMNEASDQRTGLIQQPTPSTTAYNSGNSSDPSSSPENSYGYNPYNSYERNHPREDVVMSGTAPSRNSRFYANPDTMAGAKAAEMHLPTEDLTPPQSSRMSYPVAAAAASAPYGAGPQHPNRLSGPPMMTTNQPSPMLSSVAEAPEDNDIGAARVTSPDNSYAARRESRNVRRKSLPSGAAYFDSNGDSSSGDSPPYENGAFPGATPAYYGSYQQVPSGPVDQHPGMHGMHV